MGIDKYSSFQMAKKTKEPIIVEEEVEKEEETTKTVRTRRRVDLESVNESIEDIICAIEEEITRRRQCEDKSKGGIRPLRSLIKDMKVLKKDVGRINKVKKTRKTTNPNSGFLKNYALSAEMAKFMCASESSRTEVTRKICAYIKAHPELKGLEIDGKMNYRFIRLDETLQNLLQHDSNIDGPMKYCTIQKLVTRHFIKPDDLDEEFEEIEEDIDNLSDNRI